MVIVIPAGTRLKHLAALAAGALAVGFSVKRHKRYNQLEARIAALESEDALPSSDQHAEILVALERIRPHVGDVLHRKMERTVNDVFTVIEALYEAQTQQEIDDEVVALNRLMQDMQDFVGEIEDPIIRNNGQVLLARFGDSLPVIRTKEVANALEV